MDIGENINIMKSGLAFPTNSFFESVSYSKEEDSWYFYFTNDIHIRTYKFWRLLINERIKFVSFDDGHQFGLSNLIDLTSDITKLLADKKLTGINVRQFTGDLILLITDEIKIEIYITSAGYETYDFSIDGKRYIGMGAGDIAIFDIK